MASSLKLINVLDYGAVGNGTTDDSGAINSAITATPLGGTLYFPPGYIFLVNSDTINPRPDMSIVAIGESIITGTANPLMACSTVNSGSLGLYGLNLTGLTFAPTANNTALSLASTAYNPGNVNGASLTACKFYSPANSSSSGTLVECTYGQGWSFINCSFIAEDPVAGGVGTWIGLQLNGCSGFQFTNCLWNSLTYGVNAGAEGSSLSQGLSWSNCIWASLTTCFTALYVQNYQIVNSQLENSPQLINDTNGNFVLLENNFFAGESGSWLQFTSGEGVLNSLPVFQIKITGNQFYPASSPSFTEFINFTGTSSLPTTDIIISDNLFNSIGFQPANVITLNYFQQVAIHDNIFDLTVTNAVLHLSNDKVASSGLWSHFYDNLRYNPIGQITAPSVPASGGAAYNHTGYDAFVVCTGGSNITITYGGVTMPHTGFPFPAAGSLGIIVSYTTAPTWQWIEI